VTGDASSGIEKGKPARFSAVPASGIGLVLLSMTTLQFGTAFAKMLMATAGVLGITFLRNVFSALVLWAVTRPDVSRYSARQWKSAAMLGVVTACMNVAFYAAVARIPIALATAIDFLGPITVAVVKSRRRSQLLWPALAYAGVLLLTPIGHVSSLDPLGIAYALCAAVGWGLYIVLTARTSQLFGQAAGLTLATSFGALTVLPLLFFVDLGGLTSPLTLLLSLGVAVLSTTIPFSLDFLVLRKMSERVFGVLLSIEPAISALIGLALMGEALGVGEWVAIVVVICAAAGAAWEEPPAETPSRT
jgi:inner membrane transporter RhtA